MKTIYLMRHSEPLKPIDLNNNDSLQIQNEKWGLTINGEELDKSAKLVEEAKKGNLILYEYPNRPDNMPLDNSDLIEKYVFSEKKGNKGAVKKLLKIYPEFKDRVEELRNQIN